MSEHAPDPEPQNKNIAREEIEKIRAERDEYLAGWQRAKADLINFRRQTEERTGELSDIVLVRLVRKLLPVIDAFEESAKSDIDGLANIHLLLMQILRDEGVKEIEASNGDEFNPKYHEAIDGTGTTIREIIQKGYTYKDYVIRPTKVHVA